MHVSDFHFTVKESEIQRVKVTQLTRSNVGRSDMEAHVTSVIFRLLPPVSSSSPFPLAPSS